MRMEPMKRESPKADPGRPDSGRSGRIPVLPAQNAPEEPLFKSAMPEQKAFPVAPVAIGIVAALAIAGYFLIRSGPAPKAPIATPTMNPAESAALARVRELESRLAALEAEKVAAEQKAAEDAKKTIEAQARARGRAVDPAELQRAQEDARKKAQADQEARLSAERQKIEEERKRAEETRASEAAKAASAAAAATPLAPVAPAPTPTPLATNAFTATPSSTATATPASATAPSPAPATPGDPRGSHTTSPT